jgi:hypothetical protein
MSSRIYHCVLLLCSMMCPYYVGVLCFLSSGTLWTGSTAYLNRKTFSSERVCWAKEHLKWKSHISELINNLCRGVKNYPFTVNMHFFFQFVIAPRHWLVLPFVQDILKYTMVSANFKLNMNLPWYCIMRLLKCRAAICCDCGMGETGKWN